MDIDLKRTLIVAAVLSNWDGHQSTDARDAPAILNVAEAILDEMEKRWPTHPIWVELQIQGGQGNIHDNLQRFL